MRYKGIVLVSPTPSPDGARRDASRTTSLQRVANRPIICHVVEALASAGVAEVAVVTPFELAEEIMRCIEAEGPSPVKLRYLAHEHEAKPVEALRAVADFAGNAPTIIHRADGLLGQPLEPLVELLAPGEDAPDIVLFVVQGARNSERVGAATRSMLHIAELDPAKAPLGIAGVCLLGPGMLRGLDLGGSRLRSIEPGPLAESLIAHNGSRAQVGPVREWHRFAGDPLDLLAMNRAVLDALDEPTPASEPNDNRFEGSVSIDPTASVISSVICGPVVVGAGAYIADSYVGPHTAVGERVHLEGVEIERSIVLAGASILYVGGRIVASIVGRDARIFRDFSVPRAMRLRVGDGDEVALC